MSLFIISSIENYEWTSLLYQGPSWNIQFFLPFFRFRVQESRKGNWFWIASWNTKIAYNKSIQKWSIFHLRETTLWILKNLIIVESIYTCPIRITCNIVQEGKTDTKLTRWGIEIKKYICKEVDLEKYLIGFVRSGRVEV